MLTERLVGLHTTNNIQAHIRLIDKRIGIRYKTYWRGINHNIGILRTQIGEQFSQLIGVNQLTRIGRNRTGTHQIEPYLFVMHQCVLNSTISYQIVGNTHTPIQT